MEKMDEKVKKIVGIVTSEERDEIKSLYRRRCGLLELSKTLVDLDKEELENSFYYEKLILDIEETSRKFQNWWDEKSKKYGWENIKGYQWEIDFESCKIFLVKK
jgi:CXXX repeat modification system protein